MANLLTAERRNKIAEILVANGSIKISEIAAAFQVSTETIRKDLIYLDKIGVAKKSHGGAISSLECIEKPLEDREMRNFAVKSAIAQKAISYIKEKSVIFIDAGSTTLCVTKLLHLKKGLTVITNSLSAANALVGSGNLIHMSGGQLNDTTMALEGFGATNFLGKIKVDVAFLGSSGFEQHSGPTSIDFTDADVKRAMIHNSKLTIVVADSSKAKSTALVQYADWKDIDVLITDDRLGQDALNQLQNSVNVVAVESPAEEQRGDK